MTSSSAAFVGRPVQHADRDDPLGAVLTLGDRAVKYGALIGLVFGLSTHGVAAGRALMSLTELRTSVEQMRYVIHEFLWTEYDIDLKQPEPQKAEPEKPKEEPPPTPDPEPVVQQAPKADKPQDPYDEKPAPVQAAKVLTAPSDPGKVEDLTGEGIVSGDNTNGPLGGQSSAAGTATAITHAANADVNGKSGGTGTGTAPPPPPPSNKPDLSAPATVTGGSSWSNCPFPDEADTDQIDYAQVTIIVTVRPDGSPQSAQVTAEVPPGKGFGRQARMCALARKYGAGKDADGNATTKSTPPIRITFNR